MLFKKRELKPNDSGPDTNLSYLALRRWFGIIAIALPFLLIIFNNGVVEEAMSHHYYSTSSVFFTGGLLSFGLFLMAYRGRTSDKVWLSDNSMTHIGGAGAMLTALIPKRYCSECADPEIVNKFNDFCAQLGITTQWVHNVDWVGAIHLSVAAIFIAIMGYMSFFRFTKEVTDWKKWLYKGLGIGTWLGLFICALVVWTPFDINGQGVFWGEFISLELFGISWIVKGRFLKSYMGKRTKK